VVPSPLLPVEGGARLVGASDAVANSRRRQRGAVSMANAAATGALPIGGRQNEWSGIRVVQPVRSNRHENMNS